VRRGVNFNTPGRSFPPSGSRSPAVSARELFTRNQSVLGGDGSIIHADVSAATWTTPQKRAKRDGHNADGRMCTRKTCVFAPLARNSRASDVTRVPQRGRGFFCGVLLLPACVHGCMRACVHGCVHADVRARNARAARDARNRARFKAPSCSGWNFQTRDSGSESSRFSGIRT